MESLILIQFKDCALRQAGLVTVSSASQGNTLHCFLFKSKRFGLQYSLQ